MLIMGGCGCGTAVYGNFLCLPLNFEVKLKLLKKMVFKKLPTKQSKSRRKMKEMRIEENSKMLPPNKTEGKNN